MYLLEIIGSILGFGFNLVIGLIKIIIVAAIAGIAFYKGYNPWFFGLGALITPWPISFLLLFIMNYLPKRYPKFPSYIRNHSAFEGKNPVIAAIMALCAMIAKADGNVTKEEIHFIREFIKSHFGISSQELNDYADAFEYGKQHPEEYMTFTDMVFGYYRTRRDYVIALAYLFVGVAFQEGVDAQIKEAQTKKIVVALGLTEYEYQAIRMAYLAQSQQYEQSYGQSYQNQGFGAGYTTQEDLVKKYSEVLGVSEEASMAEIKRAYRKLVKEYHPDKLASGSVPPEYIEFANKKIRDINEAYEYLEKVKGGK